MDWVAVGLCWDVPAGTAVPRRVAETDLAVWCSATGIYHAWGDRCPHRGMRLSHGFVRGETLACIYHGWQYDSSAACKYVPAHPDLVPPKTICAQRHACEQKDGAIWVALSPTQAMVPTMGERRAVRSIDMALSADDVADKLGKTLAPIVIIGGEFDLAIAVQPSTQTTCVLHVFAAPDQDRKQVSRHLEKMRAEMELAA